MKVILQDAVRSLESLILLLKLGNTMLKLGYVLGKFFVSPKVLLIQRYLRFIVFHQDFELYV